MPREFLDTNAEYEAKAFLSNVKQLSLQVRANRKFTTGKSVSSFSEHEEGLFQKINAAENLLREGKYSASLKKSDDAILLAKEALSYFRGYYKYQYLLCLTVMWLGWIVLLFLKVAGTPRENISMFWVIVNDVVFSIIGVVLVYKHYGKYSCEKQKIELQIIFEIQFQGTKVFDGSVTVQWEFFLCGWQAGP